MQLTNMAAVYTKIVDKIFDKTMFRLDNTSNWEKEIDNTPVLELLERLAKLNQAAREQVKDIAALNRPKVCENPEMLEGLAGFVVEPRAWARARAGAWAGAGRAYV